ncbi:tRNA (guanosine(37)-N1)-methyltransferase TrmD [Candidatus Woesebacteria bacterium RIFOXYB1_FULL_40_26]|uniref:tRNA (guanine-N(1)-)-methyltransferase n=1 Tax=Candidatus Woesebacteria bacterium RIFOXYB1_FULL_40_26 TaxID=1802539 RepID=A0A1F8CWY8_9BACT|nr:MAG: tRNA (guanosine(37)-N1)-methyltransferase TrmD [Candidatus Woesebacteria bacterium RIFOXYB1_FULL_40_26]
MKIDILTLFPKMFAGPFDESILRRAQDKSLVEIKIYDLRKWGQDARKTVDDRPYGGGVGMIIRVDVVARAISNFQFPISNKNKRKIVLLDAGGEPFVQKKAVELSKLEHLILIAGHYEGVDHRVHEHLVDEVISIGDYVLTGGEIPAMVITDAVTRLIPGVLEKPGATTIESFSDNAPALSEVEGPHSYLEFPQYTRPETYKGWKVPEVLLKGNHKEIEKWRLKKSTERTKARRPDLLK